MCGQNTPTYTGESPFKNHQLNPMPGISTSNYSADPININQNPTKNNLYQKLIKITNLKIHNRTAVILFVLSTIFIGYLFIYQSEWAIKGVESNNTGYIKGYGRECPENHHIKGNINSSGDKIYHVREGKYYGNTFPEYCFATEKDATEAGFRKSSR